MRIIFTFPFGFGLPIVEESNFPDKFAEALLYKYLYVGKAAFCMDLSCIY